MTQESLPKIVFALLMVAWFVFAGVFLFRKNPPRQEETQRERRSFLGIFLQALGYFLVWTPPMRRPFFTHFLPMPLPLELVWAIVTIGLTLASEVLIITAARTLGRQWAIAARLVEGHKLVTEGPYQFVRNPIYTGMLGMMLATGLAVSQWWAILLASVPFVIGTVIRVRSEEKLLRSAFGQEFENYAQRVPAVMPGIY
jgi:protein-S-isoprenylcysteine O-methyltransferase Ste14